jgi:alpha-amylase
LATLARRFESYHRKVLAGPSESNGDIASIHDRVVFKQEGLDKRVQYDKHLRKSLLDHFYDNDATLAAVASGAAAERGDFIDAPYEARVRRNPDRTQVLLIREGMVHGAPIRLTKGVSLNAGSSSLEVAYVLEGLPRDYVFHFGVEFNFAGMPGGADDRFFHGLDGERLGQLGTRLDLQETTGLGLTDQWLGLDIGLQSSRPTRFWTFPIETVSQSEGGFELVHQSVVVQPHWFVTPDAEGRWSVTLNLSLDTSLAESRTARPTTAAAQ